MTVCHLTETIRRLTSLIQRQTEQTVHRMLTSAVTLTTCVVVTVALSTGTATTTMTKLFAAAELGDFGPTTDDPVADSTDQSVLKKPPVCSLHVVAWYSGGTPVFDRWTFAVLRSICSWWVTTYVGKPSAVGQPTRPTQPFILLE